MPARHERWKQHLEVELDAGFAPAWVAKRRTIENRSQSPINAKQPGRPLRSARLFALRVLCQNQNQRPRATGCTRSRSKIKRWEPTFITNSSRKPGIHDAPERPSPTGWTNAKACSWSDSSVLIHLFFNPARLTHAVTSPNRDKPSSGLTEFTINPSRDSH